MMMLAFSRIYARRLISIRKRRTAVNQLTVRTSGAHFHHVTYSVFPRVIGAVPLVEDLWKTRS